jgi:hypothetical protein
VGWRESIINDWISGLAQNSNNILAEKKNV